MATPEPNPPDDPGPTLTNPPGVPEGMFLALPQPSTPAEQIPPIPVEFGFGLTAKDAKGHRWAVLQATDGTVTNSYRIPWQMATQIGMQIAQGLNAMQQKAAAEENSGLVVPGRENGGGLVVARPGRTPLPNGTTPLNLGKRRGR